MAKQLKPTIKSYSLAQVVNHAENTSLNKIKLSWSNMENMQYTNKYFCSDTQTTYTYAAEASLTDGSKTLASVERWSSYGGKMFKSCSMYRVWIWLNDQPYLFGQFTDTTLKECKDTVTKYLQNNH